MTNYITTKDIESFFKILAYLEEKQIGVMGLNKLYKYHLRVLKYKGIGEGMEFETAEDYDLKALKEELLKRTIEEAL